MRMYVLLAILSLFVQESLLLRIVRVSIPSYRMRGQAAQLECDYELDNDKLYSVKWYRDNEEFYRYMPKFDPPKHSYKLEGIKVDLPKSDDKKVVLHQVTLKSSGLYRCEVSAEAPSFASAAGEARMDVVYLPKDGPKITGNQAVARRGDLLFINCTSGRSYPPTQLHWNIDGKKLTDPNYIIEYPPVYHAHGLVTTSIGLKMPVPKSMEIRCHSHIMKNYWQDGNDAVIGTNLLTDSKEAMLLVRSSGKASNANVILLALSTAILLSLPIPTT